MVNFHGNLLAVRKCVLAAKKTLVQTMRSPDIPVEVDCVGGDGDHDQYLESDLVLFGDVVLVTYLQALLSHYF